MNHSPLNNALIITSVLSAVACGDIDQNENAALEVANATFALSSSQDCVDAFATRSFLRELSRQKNWGEDDIMDFCDEVTRVATTYQTSDTLTIATIGGGLARNGVRAKVVYFQGIAGYNLSAIKAWLGEVRASRAIQECSRRAASAILGRQPIPPQFVRTCLEDVSGETYPAPIFTDVDANLVGGEANGTAAALGIAATLVVYNAPGQGTVVSFLAGGFYGQASNPPYFGTLGCGVVVGFDEVEQDGGLSYICLGAEYR